MELFDHLQQKMSKKDKLLLKLKNSSENESFDELIQLLTYYEFLLVRVKGSHHIFRRDHVTFVLPFHGKNVKSIYVKRCLEIITNQFGA